MINIIYILFAIVYVSRTILLANLFYLNFKNKAIGIIFIILDALTMILLIEVIKTMFVITIVVKS